jgi:two-component system, NtrC family, sensor kinase
LPEKKINPENSREASKAAFYLKKWEETKTELEGHEGLLKLSIKELRKTYDDLLASQKQLYQSDKLATIGIMTAGIIHEVGNPLTFIDSNTQFLKDSMEKLTRYVKAQGKLEDISELPKLKEKFQVDENLKGIEGYLHDMMVGTDRMCKIVEDLKTFAHARPDKFVEADIHSILEGVLSMVRVKMKNRIELKKEFGNVPPLMCNSQQLGQVFINLLINASDAIEGKGIIALKTFAKSGQIVVRVSDTGSGIPDKVKKKMFDPLFTTKEVGKGTGLGLSISVDIIKNHKGTIEVDSVVGKGTTFTITLPISVQEESHG